MLDVSTTTRIQVGLGFNITDDDQWQCLVITNFTADPCCPEGHPAPEVAAQHGSILAAELMSVAARALPGYTLGGTLLTRNPGE